MGLRRANPDKWPGAGDYSPVAKGRETEIVRPFGNGSIEPNSLPQRLS
jgi:hypothetical protein